MRTGEYFGYCDFQPKLIGLLILTVGGIIRETRHGDLVEVFSRGGIPHLLPLDHRPYCGSKTRAGGTLFKEGSRSDLEEKMLLPAQRTLDVSVRPVSLWLYRWGFSLALPGDQIAPLRRLYLPTGVHSLCCGSGSMLLASQWGRGGSTLARQGCPDRTMTYLYACYAIAFLSGRIIGPNFLAEVGVLCFRGGGRGCGG